MAIVPDQLHTGPIDHLGVNLDPPESNDLEQRRYRDMEWPKITFRFRTVEFEVPPLFTICRAAVYFQAFHPKRNNLMMPYK